ncbi:dihydroorotase [Asticcacaulis excentricus]|uniref:Dihydroorotase, multifunctional complex type n=1 Tax=Asticcacaulis excentricus (strain ATCC 15261 / DSM 4724 / KCTC 12464 / NCIMB 9791 / VKM B-1370 / CB 48) TaxID=573065 RepID=E8RTK5_ASTEC|nr:dihydroorotase [Asticcacaulis excentricus]ADU14826.1 dihydroorotase, multifunctional complex type [Asticcacaulis excentricus CB 48]
MKQSQAIALVNARLIDPASDYDGPGSLILTEGVIAEVLHTAHLPSGSADMKVIDCDGKVVCPGLIDLRVKTGEPGAEPKETLKSASRAAAAGGVTSMVVQPDTDPVIDEPAMVDFILRRARDIELVHVYPAGAATKGHNGKQMAEIGLMSESGAVYFTDVERPIINSKVLARVLSYANGFNALIAHRPKEPWLSEGAVATSGEMAARMGLSGVSALAERIALERDLALVELTGARLLVDQITTAGAIKAIAQAKAKGLDVYASASINHLVFNEIDIGDYRTFYRLDPPLRCEDDRIALVEALADGLIDVVVSNHTPLPAEDKRRPFSEAEPGAIGLQTLLAALIGLHHDREIPLIDLLRTVTINPAQLIGLEAGRLSPGAPADLIVVDIDAPFALRESDILSKSKNSPFENRTLQGKVEVTLVDGRIVYQA